MGSEFRGLLSQRLHNRAMAFGRGMMHEDYVKVCVEMHEADVADLESQLSEALKEAERLKGELEQERTTCQRMLNWTGPVCGRPHPCPDHHNEISNIIEAKNDVIDAQLKECIDLRSRLAQAEEQRRYWHDRYGREAGNCAQLWERLAQAEEALRLAALMSDDVCGFLHHASIQAELVDGYVLVHGRLSPPPERAAGWTRGRAHVLASSSDQPLAALPPEEQGARLAAFERVVASVTQEPPPEGKTCGVKVKYESAWGINMEKDCDRPLPCSVPGHGGEGE